MRVKLARCGLFVSPATGWPNFLKQTLCCCAVLVLVIAVA